MYPVTDPAFQVNPDPHTDLVPDTDMDPGIWMTKFKKKNS
jgi:hypothetical protein